MDVGITSIGTAVPPYCYTQKETIEFLASNLQLTIAEKRRLGAIYRSTGIHKRYSVINDHLKEKGRYTFFPNNERENFPTTKARMELYRQTAPALSINAVQECLNGFDHEYDLKSLTHIITVSCTGMYAPGLDLDLIQHFKLSTTLHRTAINFMGCYGAFNAMKAAYAVCKSDAKAKVLIVCLELCSIHFQKPEILDHIISTAIFGDGAAAVIVESKGTNNANLKNDFLKNNYLKLEDFYCEVLPQSEQEMTWCISNSGFDIVLSSYVPKLIESGIKQFFQRFLEKRSYDEKKSFDFDQVDQYAIHPGGMKILEACETALGINKEHNRYSYEVLRDYGNMSSATILFVLKKVWEDLKKNLKEKLKDGEPPKNILCCAFGPGLTLESMLVRNCHG